MAWDEIIHWTPRVLSLVIAGFLYLFVLEGFSENWTAAIYHFALATVFLLLALASWKWEKIGGSVYIGLGLYIIFAWRRKLFTVIFSIALMVIGLLFILNKCY